jgi:mRNA deadenylase 3'-5' endonuclease subunit Ccr4
LRRLVRRRTHVKQYEADGGGTDQATVVTVVPNLTKKNAATSTTATTCESDINNCISPDLLALQEVDPPLGVASCLKEQGYEAIETVATKGGRVGRVDSCGLYYKEDVWTCVRHETVFLDDLATNCSSDIVGNYEKIGGGGNDNTIDRSKRTSNNMNESLRGLQTSLSRKNVALLVRLHHKPTRREVVVVNAHLFWNPAYEYVKVSLYF